jgi:hypothetical protein
MGSGGRRQLNKPPDQASLPKLDGRKPHCFALRLERVVTFDHWVDRFVVALNILISLT